MHSVGTILIIGAGPTGLGAAWRLHELNYPDWHLIDQSKCAGGLASSVVDPQGFVWDLGGHVLYSHYPSFDRLMEALLGDAWQEHDRHASIWMRNRFIPYPLQYNLWRLPTEELLQCLKGLLHANQKNHFESQADNFESWILQHFGEGLAQSFFIPYNTKVWAFEPSKLDKGWIGERIAPVDLFRVLQNLVLQHDDGGWGPNATFRFPRYGGTGSIWKALQQRLPEDRVSFGKRCVFVDPVQHRAHFQDGSTQTYDFLISSMPLDLLLKSYPPLERYAGAFLHSSSHIIGIGMEGSPPQDLKDKSWMYFPESDTPFYRVTVFSNYSPYNVPHPDKQWSLLCEVSESFRKSVDPHSIASETVQALRRIAFIPPGATVISLWHTRLEYGYPTPFLGRDSILQAVDPVLRGMGIFSRGRFGGWKYEVSNQDHSFMQGVEAVNHLLNGDEESTYLHPDRVNQPQRVLSSR